jgi:outer membrane protein assembly factor BamB
MGSMRKTPGRNVSRSVALFLAGLAALITGCGPAGAPGAAGASGAGSAPGSGHRTAAAGSPPGETVVTTRLAGGASPVPAVAGSTLRPLWQGAPWGDLTISDGLVIGIAFRDGHPAVRAASALTGAGVWSAQLPARLTEVLGVVAGDGVVVVEAGHDFGHAPLMVAAEVTEAVVLDERTGRELWAAGVEGRSQNPPIALSGNAVLIGAPSGVITARDARSGKVLWQSPRPGGCAKITVASPVDEGMGLAADGGLAAASFECAGGRMLAERLNPATGAALWSWQSPRTGSGDQAFLSVTGVATQGSVVLLTGQDAPPSGALRLARSLPRPSFWPASLGPLDDVQVVLALDAQTGRPRWTELGGQGVDFTLADGAVCEVVNTGFECRDDVTGALTRPVLVTGQSASATPPYADDGWAGISGPYAGAVVAPLLGGHVTVDVLGIRTHARLGRAELAIGFKARSANYQTFVVAAGTLPSGKVLLLLRRVDGHGQNPVYPVIALEVTAR